MWLDYSNMGPKGWGTTWAEQTAWADGLGAVLTINLYSEYSVTWDDPNWRLPSTVDGPFVVGDDGTTTGGYNVTSSEMGHLYYTELGNLGYDATDGTHPQPGWGLANTGDFDHLLPRSYWSGTEYAAISEIALVWKISMDDGFQAINSKTGRLAGLWPFAADW